jgi:hypothetical protein
MATVRKFPFVLGLMEVNSEQVEQGVGNFIPTDNKHTETLARGEVRWPRTSLILSFALCRDIALMHHLQSVVWEQCRSHSLISMHL